MAQINTLGLTATQIGRLEQALEKQYNNGGQIQTMREMLAELPDHPDKEITDGMIDWNRRHFNRLDGRQQDDYMDRLKKKRKYCLRYADPLMALMVPKIVFDAVPGRIVQNVDEDRRS